MGASLGRASNFGRIADYADTANAHVCLIAQIESRLGVENADAILAVEGVDAVLIGPPISLPTWAIAARRRCRR